MSQPRRISPEDFAQAMHKVCAKCRKSLPLAKFRVLLHMNQHTGRGQQVHHGWAERCEGCEAEDG